MAYCIFYIKLLIFIMVAITLANLQSTENAFAAGVNAFTSDIYKELIKSKSENFVVCPLSAETILALVHAGAEGNTAKQLANALNLPNDKEQIQQSYKTIVPLLKSDGNKYNLTSANKVYVKKGYKVNQNFTSIAVNVFGAEAQSIDFEKQSQAAAEINQWVERKTKNKIKNLVNANDFDNDTRAVLVNAMYFHGKWVQPFLKENTEKMNFHVNSKTKVKVDMMQQTNTFLYKEDEKLNFKVLVLPYDKDSEVSMWFILPNDVDGLSKIEANIKGNNDILLLSRNGLRKERVQVAIPKFKAETTIELNPILENLGIVDAFQSNASFDGIIVDQSLAISKSIQKTFIEVDEKGTEAAAATGVIHITPVAMPGMLIPPKEFIASHPFIYFIKIKDIFFFIGRYALP